MKSNHSTNNNITVILNSQEKNTIIPIIITEMLTIFTTKSQAAMNITITDECLC